MTALCIAAYPHYTARLKRSTLSRAAFEIVFNAMVSAEAAASIVDGLDAGDVEWEAQSGPGLRSVWGGNGPARPGAKTSPRTSK